MQVSRAYIKSLMVPAAIVALLLTMGQDAKAAFKLELSSGATTVTITDGGAGDSSATAGVIAFNGSVGANFSINITTGISKPVLGSAFEAKMDLNSVNVSSLGAGTLTIRLTDTDFILPNKIGDQMVLTNSWGGTTNGSITAQGFASLSNTEFDTSGGATPFQGPFGPGAFSSTASSLVGPFTAANQAFSLTEVVTITHTGKGQVTSFDKEITAVVPEPGTLMLFGMGLLGVAAYGWRRRKQKLA